MIALQILLICLFTLTSVIFTGPYCLRMTGFGRFFTGFGVFAMMNMTTNLMIIGMG